VIGLGLHFIGTDGSAWDLRDVANFANVYVTDGGIQGLGMAPLKFFTREGAVSDGETVTGFKTERRKVFLPCLIGRGSSPTEFLELSTRWWRANEPGEYAQLQAILPNGEMRTLSMRFNDDGGAAHDQDPLLEGAELVGITYYADEDPFWHGPAVKRVFGSNASSDNFFGGATGLAPDFVISSDYSTANATFDNPGNVDAWPTYILAGPLSYSIRTGGGLIEGPALAVGDTLVIRTEQRYQDAILTRADGSVTNITPDLTSIDFRPIPKGGSVPLMLTTTGSGSVTVIVEPRYTRAYGS
jgi:hypothetical protein